MLAIVENEKYKLYEEYDNIGNKYYLTIPNNNALEYQIYCSLNEDTDTEVLSKVCANYESIIQSNKQAIYLHLILDSGELAEAAAENDSHLYKFMIKKILTSLKHAYQIIIQTKIAGINNEITFINQNKDDKKFFDWIEITGIIPIRCIKLDSELKSYVDIPLNDTPNDSGGASLIGADIELSENKPLVRKKTPPKNNHGFGNIVLVVLTHIITIACGITIAYLLIK